MNAGETKRDEALGSHPVERARVLLIYTGGTIGMVLSDRGNPASPLRPGTEEEMEQTLRHSFPDLVRKYGITWELRVLPDTPPVDSSDVTPEHWGFIAELLQSEYANWDGFVVLHGTDTMAYTAAGLSFILNNLAKPVVVTGSQLPFNDARSDGRLNLVNAVMIAGYKATGLPLVPEVVLCFGDALLRGNRATKVSTRDLNGFESPNFPKLGELGERILIRRPYLRHPPDNLVEPFYVSTNLETNVIDLAVSPGLREDQLRGLIDNEELRGIVLRSYGAGNVPSAVVPLLREAVRAGKVVVNVTQCPHGMVEQGLYESSSELLEAGVTTGLDMTPEAALAKLFWLLGTEIADEVKAQLEINQRGEQSYDLFDLEFPSQDRPVELIVSAARPIGLITKDRVNEAFLRITGVVLESETGGGKEVRVFLNHTSADRSTDTASPYCAAVFTAELPEEKAEGESHHRATCSFVREITGRFRQLFTESHPVSMTVVAGPDTRVSYKGLCLSVLATAK